MKLSRKARRQVLVGTGLVVAGGAAWWEFGRAPVKRTTEVGIQNPQFSPRNIRISPGDTVTWTNTEPEESQTAMGHRITNATDNWSMDEFIDVGDEVEYTFEEEGVYDAACEIHDGERMRIGVGTGFDALGGWF
jgi:plastocyanin